MGGIGRTNLTNFYRDHFIFQNPPDTDTELVSRTVGIDRVIDEFIFKFTHTCEIDWLYTFCLLPSPRALHIISMPLTCLTQPSWSSTNASQSRGPFHVGGEYSRRPIVS